MRKTSSTYANVSLCQSCNKKTWLHYTLREIDLVEGDFVCVIQNSTSMTSDGQGAFNSICTSVANDMLAEITPSEKVKLPA